MLMLIDTRPHPPWPPARAERRPVELNWRIWSWAALALLLFGVSLVQAAVLASLLLVGSFACAIRALGIALDRSGGLRDHRQ